MTSDFVGQRIHRPWLSTGFSIVLATKIQNLVSEGLVAIPAVTRENAAIFHCQLASVDSNNGNVVWSIA